ncbi:alanine racemase [Nocardioides bruguierae]|uniref:alanine racemase n=1 Tax=Nocardioides bruguierae TaxID=2945102 RepID=UPI0020204C17|nr:alanine racemase [Nocardioides bruguierae]MCL8027232.1 alanine racemase [Nocardioides bruguierae]
MSATARPEIVVDLAAVRHNLRTIDALVGDDVATMAVVKADAYGHGALEVARAAREAGTPWLGVATVPEALALREAGDVGRLLCWLVLPGEDLTAAVAADVDVTAATTAHLDLLARAVEASGRPARVQLKVDTGLSRSGSTAEAWPALVAAARAGELEGRWRVTGVWSHLAAAEEPEHPANAQQAAAFHAALAVVEEAGLRPEVRHLANSAAALLHPDLRLDLVRIGLATYGLDPAPDVAHGTDLRPAMTVTAPLTMVKQVPEGTSVSYGWRWSAPAPTTLGLVPVGYADGLPRAAAGNDRPGPAGAPAEVEVGGRRRPLRGTVCMDQVVVELGPAGTEVGAAVGDVVRLVGPAPAPSAQEWAQACGTISYEIVTRLGGRLVRRHVDSEEGA